jgi:hypothetical protein
VFLNWLWLFACLIEKALLSGEFSLSVITFHLSASCGAVDGSLGKQGVTGAPNFHFCQKE